MHNLKCDNYGRPAFVCSSHQALQPDGAKSCAITLSKLKESLTLAMLCSMLLILACSCSDSKSEPKLGSAPVIVNVNVDTTMTYWQDYVVDSRASSAPLLRCKLQALSSDNNILASETHIFHPGEPLTTTFKLKLPSDQYHLMAWCDYVDASQPGADLHYLTTDLRDVTFTGNYQGNDPSRNAYSGVTPIDFKVYEGDTTTVINSDITLQPIMGKIKFVATDYNQFLIKPLDLRIMVAYTGFLPHRYSVVRGVPFDATTGIYFLSEMSECSTEGDGSATLGYDYVMVNGDESSVTVALGLYNDEGKLVGQTGNINVPIKRGGLTVVKGHFLTKTQSSGGIGIDPSFNGDINVYY